MILRSKTVLVVEDEALLRLGIVGDLEDAGLIALEAANADAAILLLEAHPSIDLLFTDIDMPGSMDGMRLAAVVGRRWPPIRVIVTSGHKHTSAVDLAVGQLFMAKPYDALAVASAFRKMLAAQPSLRV